MTYAFVGIGCVAKAIAYWIAARRELTFRLSTANGFLSINSFIPFHSLLILFIVGLDRSSTYCLLSIFFVLSRNAVLLPFVPHSLLTRWLRNGWIHSSCLFRVSTVGDGARRMSSFHFFQSKTQAEHLFCRCVAVQLEIRRIQIYYVRCTH